MRKTFTIIFLTMIGSNLFCQINNSNPIFEANVDVYSTLIVEDGIDVEMYHRGFNKIEIFGANDDDIVFEESAKTLKIYRKHSIFKSGRARQKVRLYFSSIDKIIAGGASNIKIEEIYKPYTQRVEMDIHSSAVLSGNISVKTLAVHLDSSAIVELEGTAQNFQLQTSSGSKFKGTDFITFKTVIEAYTGSEVDVFVNDVLYAYAHLGAKITFTGNASEIYKKNTLGGKIYQNY